MQQRDGYFTRLKNRIEIMHELQGQKVRSSLSAVLRAICLRPLLHIYDNHDTSQHSLPDCMALSDVLRQ